jgi:Replication-relaxation
MTCDALISPALPPYRLLPNTNCYLLPVVSRPACRNDPEVPVPDIPAAPSPSLPPSTHPAYTARHARLHHHNPSPDTSRTPESRHPRSSSATLAGRLTDRDRWLLAMLAEHRVLTTHQAARLAFPSRRTASRRLLTLARYGLLDSFRPWVPAGAGSAPEHYLLSPTGAHLLARAHDCKPQEFGWRPDLLESVAYSPSLGHTVGCNDILTRLAHHARTHPNTQLTAWWSARSCARIWGHHVRPDAYARWHHHGQSVDFFLEYDTGSEQLPRVAGKLTGYARLAEATGIATPVLFHLPSSAREDHLHALFATIGTRPGHQVPIATTHATAADPATPVWKLAPHDDRRRALHDLPTAPTADHSPAPVAVTTADRPGWTPPDPTPPDVSRRRS